MMELWGFSKLNYFGKIYLDCAALRCAALRCAALRCHDGGEPYDAVKHFLIMSTDYNCWWIFSPEGVKFGPYPSFAEAARGLSLLPKGCYIVTEQELFWGLLAEQESGGFTQELGEFTLDDE
jgi:hypothetical protein